MNIKENITELIGNTPMLKINSLSEESGANIVVKLENFNPMSSIKDRPALNIVLEAEKSGALKPGGTIIEATSGNTGVGLALVAAAKGYKTLFTMPDTMSVERRTILSALGAELVLTAGKDGMKGAISKAAEIQLERANSILAAQFSNKANPDMHKKTTALEILKDTDGKIDILVAGVGSGGTITGVGSVLKEQIPGIKIVAVEPDTSSVIAGAAPGPHKIQGIGAGFITENTDVSIIDEIVTVNAEEAGAMSRAVAQNDGVLGGISSGANLAAAMKLAKLPENKGKTIVTFICDTGERYLSTWLYN